MCWLYPQIIEAESILKADADGHPLEASLTKGLRHPNIVQMLGFTTHVRPVSLLSVSILLHGMCYGTITACWGCKSSNPVITRVLWYHACNPRKMVSRTEAA